MKLTKPLRKVRKSKIKKIFFHFLNSEDFELKFIYIVSPLDQKADQELENFFLPSDRKGKFKVFLNIRPPDFSTVSLNQIIGVTAILFIVSYENQELIRIGYYLNNEISLNEEEINKIQGEIPLDLIKRSILTGKPRVTVFPSELE